MTTKTEAGRVARAVIRALKRPECLRWRDLNYPASSRYDDGPCLHVALAIAAADGHRGRIREVAAGAHAVYVLAGVAIDGHGVYNLRRRLSKREVPRPIGFYHQKEIEHKGKASWAIDWYLEALRPPFTLVRAIRIELRRAK